MQVESGPIKWEEFKEIFLLKYFPHEKRDVKVQEFINLSKLILVLKSTL